MWLAIILVIYFFFLMNFVLDDIIDESLYLSIQSGAGRQVARKQGSAQFKNEEAQIPQGERVMGSVW